MKISVLGVGCATCKKLYQFVEKVVKVEHLDAEIEYSTDITRITELGLISSPVLVVDGKPVDLKSISEKDVKDAIRNPNNKTDNQEKTTANNCACGGTCS